MKKHVWTEAALLVALPLGGAWYFWHVYVLIAVALMAAAFAFIVGSQICTRREIRQKQQQLKGSAERDGRYLAEHINSALNSGIRARVARASLKSHARSAASQSSAILSTAQ